MEKDAKGKLPAEEEEKAREEVERKGERDGPGFPTAGWTAWAPIPSGPCQLNRQPLSLHDPSDDR